MRLKIALIFIIIYCPIHSQSRKDFRVMFYNVENLFDTNDDKFTNDNEYTPDGRFKWTQNRYQTKLLSVFKVISGIGENYPPEIIGLCEVENKQVLHDLLTQTPLNKFPFQIIHYDSPDPRGIDVALLYRTDKLKQIHNKSIGITFPGKYKNHKTRDILYASFLAGNDTLHLFINHWPSRRSGELESEFFRIFVAKVLKKEVESLLTQLPNAKILVMGDFNDEPRDKSLTEGLVALPVSDDLSKNGLYNLSYYYTNQQKIGTHKFKSKWEIFDQIIVSGNLLTASKKLSTTKDYVSIYSPGFLLKQDNQNLGLSPYKTFAGMHYIGGFSDHMPVYIDLVLKK